MEHLQQEIETLKQRERRLKAEEKALRKEQSRSRKQQQQRGSVKEPSGTKGGKKSKTKSGDSKGDSRGDVKGDSKGDWISLDAAGDGLAGLPPKWPPAELCGFMWKKRKRPQIGWHHRFFVLENAVLTYGRSLEHIRKGKIKGSLDVAHAEIAALPSKQRIDIDGETTIFHLQAYSDEDFTKWTAALKEHRAGARSLGTRRKSRVAELAGGDGFLAATKQAEGALAEARSIVAKMTESIAAHRTGTPHSSLRRFQSSDELRQRVAGRSESVDALPASSRRSVPSASGSITTGAHDVGEAEYVTLATRACTILTGVIESVTAERTSVAAARQGQTHEQLGDARARVAMLEAENASLRACIERIAAIATSDAVRKPHDEPSTGTPSLRRRGDLRRRASVASIDSMEAAEFFDACEEFDSSDSSADTGESDDANSVSEHGGEAGSEIGSISGAGQTSDSTSSSALAAVSSEPNVARRMQLPNERPPDGDVSLWSVLRKNIGKDLSKISMPVTLNEPLGALQRLCEELDYASLLDDAAALDDPIDRMVRVAAFAVSAYAGSQHRAGKKPFNPVLGETYECVRPDRGFAFVAEQVSHHPPVSACYCVGGNFRFWQELQIKNKFWGKSMEVFPSGAVHVTLPSRGDHYEWSKVTTCVHNIMSGDKWVDHYGTMEIRNDRAGVVCRLEFARSGMFGAASTAVSGRVLVGNKAVRTIAGTWDASLECAPAEGGGAPQVIWRATPAPANAARFYGFSQFALELNELHPHMTKVLPHTDTRFRPDQRALEDGDVRSAEDAKSRVETIQRESRKEREKAGVEWYPRYFAPTEGSSSGSQWAWNSRYWMERQSGHWSPCPPLW
eukprot:Opistho-2@18946